MPWKKSWKAFIKFLTNNKETCDPYQFLLENSTWIEPPRTLLAYQYIEGKNISVEDQTVWVIDRYEKGYFFGKTYVALNGQASSELNLVGSITLDGHVYLTFFPVNGESKVTDPVRGIGTFTVIDKRKGYFVMQTDSAESSTNGLAHWSYMISVQVNDYFYQQLPSVGISIPQFIGQFSS